MIIIYNIKTVNCNGYLKYYTIRLYYANKNNNYKYLILYHIHIYI